MWGVPLPVVLKPLCCFLFLSLTDQQEEGDGEKEKGKKRKKDEEEGRRRTVKFSHTWRICPPSPPSLSFPFWCHSMCFTGPHWAEDIRWKTSEFLNVFKGPEILNVFKGSPSPAAGRSQKETVCCVFLCLLIAVHRGCGSSRPAAPLSVSGAAPGSDITNRHLAAFTVVLVRKGVKLWHVMGWDFFLIHEMKARFFWWENVSGSNVRISFDSTLCKMIWNLPEPSVHLQARLPL